MFKKRDYVISETGLSSVEKVRLGGVDQCILIQAEDPKKPVLLIIHGGPSLPLPGVSSQGQDYTIVTNTRLLVKNFVVVFWDQRGTGSSYCNDIPQDTMNIEQFISDAEELTDYLCNRFNQNKIFLASHSWGSTIGLSLAARVPHKFYSYTGFSQIVSWTENDKLALEWIKQEAKRRGNSKALKELESVGMPPFTESFQQWSILRKWQRIFNTMIYTDEHIKHPGLMRVTKAMFQSEAYTLKDIFNTFYKGFKLVYTQRFIEELATNNLMETIKEIDLPVTFIHGSKDYHVHGSLVEQYYEKLEATHKRMIWASKSAHVFHPDDTKLNEQYLIEELRYVD